MPRHSKAAQQSLPTRTLIVDNGASTIKAGFTGDPPLPEACHVIPNCVARDRGKKVWIGSQLDKCVDFGEVMFRRPVEKGYLVNWEAEKAIWDDAFFDPGSKLKVSSSSPLKQAFTHMLQCDPHETNIILTEAPNTPAALQTNCDQMIFEEYEFATYSRHIGWWIQ